MYQPPAPAASIDPIISRLRPRSVGEILDQAFRLYRRHFLTFVAIIAVAHLPLQLALQFASALLVGRFTGLASDPTSFGNSSFSSSSTNELLAYSAVVVGVVILLSVLYWLFQQLSEGALTGAIANSHIDRPVSFGSAYRQMFSRVGPLLGVIFLQLGIGLLIILPIIVIFFLFIGLAVTSAFNSTFSRSGTLGSGNSDSAGLLGLCCLVPALAMPLGVLAAYVFVRLVAMVPAVMVERLGPVQGLRRSWGLVRNYWWRTFALLLVLGIFSYIVQAGPTALIQLIVQIVAPRDYVLQQLIGGVVSAFTTLLFIPIQLTAITLYYFDLRVRKEGYDLETALSQRYAPPVPPQSWAGAGAGYGQYGQGAPTEAIAPPPTLGQDYSGYNYVQYTPPQRTGEERPPATGESGHET